VLFFNKFKKDKYAIKILSIYRNGFKMLSSQFINLSRGQKQVQQKYKDFLLLEGTQQEVQNLQQMLDVLVRLTSGKKVLQMVKRSHGSSPLHIQFNSSLKRFGQYQTGLDTVQLMPYTEQVQKKFPVLQNYGAFLLTVLGHELQHVATEPLRVKMVQNAESLQDFLQVKLLDEAVAYKTQQSLTYELSNHQKSVADQEINLALKKVLSGQGWAKEYVQKQTQFYQETKKCLSSSTTEREVICAMQKGRFPMPAHTSKAVFNSGIAEYLKLLESDLKVQAVQSVPLAKNMAVSTTDRCL